MSESMNLQAQDLETLNQLYIMQSLLTNMLTNISLIEQGAAGQIITVNNVNLYQLAAQYYGDGTLWNTIAEANGLSDPVIQNTVTISIAGLFLTFGGFSAPQQLINITLTTQINETAPVIVTPYYYLCTANDTLNSISAIFSALIPGSIAVNNILELPPYLDVSYEISRFFTLTIPSSPIDTGGVLQS